VKQVPAVAYPVASGGDIQCPEHQHRTEDPHGHQRTGWEVRQHKPPGNGEAGKEQLHHHQGEVGERLHRRR
jgi:hypothetical protein